MKNVIISIQVCMYIIILIITKNIYLEAVVAKGNKGMTATRRLSVRSPLEGMCYYFLIFSFLRSGQGKVPASNFGTQLAMP